MSIDQPPKDILCTCHRCDRKISVTNPNYCSNCNGLLYAKGQDTTYHCSCPEYPGRIIGVAMTDEGNICVTCGDKVTSDNSIYTDKEQGIKHDRCKLRYELEPTDVRKEVIKVYTNGANKYSDRNWELGIKYSRVYGAARRHMSAFWEGENLDAEWMIHHLAHAICELEFLLAFELRKMKDFDDRPKDQI